jgi:hypothetical protein
LYCRMLKVDMSLMKNQVIKCAVIFDERINISE